MICSYTQTYSDNREQLYEFHNKDTVDIKFRNKLAINYYAFHNSPDNYREKIVNDKYLSEIKNKEILIYNNISYTQSFINTLLKIKNDGYKYMFFLQDDVFCVTNDELIQNMLNYVNNNIFDMLNIETTNINTESPIIYSKDSLKIYNTTSEDFKNKDLWAFDDGPYIANVDFLLDKIYDNIFISKCDVWEAEHYLNNKIINNKIQRLSTNNIMFQRINVVGPNSWGRVDDGLDRLKKMFNTFTGKII